MPTTITDSQYLQEEADRLAKKKANIDNEVSAQNRGSALTDSYRKRFSNYLVVLVILIFAFIGYLGITKAQEAFPQAPAVIFDVLFLLILLVVAYYVYYAMTDLAVRSNMNYDEIDLPVPKGVSVGVNPLDANNKAVNKGDITGQIPIGSANCQGNVCCGPSTKWDPNVNYCVPIQTFTTLEGATLQDASKLLISGSLPTNKDGQKPIDYHMTMYHLE